MEDATRGMAVRVGLLLVIVATVLNAKPTGRSGGLIRCQPISDTEAACTLSIKYSQTTDLVEEFRCQYDDEGRLICDDEPVDIRHEPRQFLKQLLDQETKLPMPVRRGSRCWPGPGGKPVCAG